jgi:prepilin-type N-terminal cleavage/methylation domain-containing protein
MKKNTHGFTLVELLVAIAIIGVLSSIVIASMNGARRNSDYLKRVADLGQVKLALTNYQLKYGRYPTTGGGWSGYGSCWVSGSATGNINYIPLLVTERLIARLPVDIRSTATCTNEITYIYRSDGRDYKLIAHSAPDVTIAISKNPEMRDPVRPNHAYGFWTPGAATW